MISFRTYSVWARVYACRLRYRRASSTTTVAKTWSVTAYIPSKATGRSPTAAAVRARKVAKVAQLRYRRGIATYLRRPLRPVVEPTGPSSSLYYNRHIEHIYRRLTLIRLSASTVSVRCRKKTPTTVATDRPSYLQAVSWDGDQSAVVLVSVDQHTHHHAVYSVLSASTQSLLTTLQQLAMISILYYRTASCETANEYIMITLSLFRSS